MRLLRPSLLVSLSLAPFLCAPLGCGLGIGSGGANLCSPEGHFPGPVVEGPILGAPLGGFETRSVSWRTGRRTTGAVEWGEDATYGFAQTDAAPTMRHLLSLPALQPARTYHYRILDDGVPSGGDHAFRTPSADPAAPVRFVVIGDTGTGCDVEFAAIARLVAEEPDFVVHVGDAAYPDGRESDVHSRFLVPFEDVLDTTCVFTTLGNHDVHTAGGAALLDALDLPRNPADGTSRRYSFDWGPCHVACLDTNGDLAPGSEPAAWIDGDLSASAARWTFVFGHHPPYSSSSHGSTPAVQAGVVPLLDAHHVDVELCGHDHDYERTFPMLGGVPVDAAQEPDYVDPAGTVYVVTGGGGNELYPSRTSAFTATSASRHHVTLVSVEGPTLTIEAIALDGTVFDRATITKSP
jgi:hypothetical protein